jgi:hypothetical protein
MKIQKYNPIAKQKGLKNKRNHGNLSFYTQRTFCGLAFILPACLRSRSFSEGASVPNYLSAGKMTPIAAVTAVIILD